MADQIETFYRTAYIDNIRLGAMTMRSHLRESVDFEPSRGEFLMLDSYGEIDAAGGEYLTEITTRNDANVETQVPRARRRLAPKFWELTEYFDPRDKVKLLKDIRPDSNYSRAVLGTFGRQMDKEIFVAFDANAENATGGAIIFLLAASANEVLEAVGANTGANVDKIIQSVEKLWVNKTQDDVRWYCAVNPHSVSQLFSFTNDDRLLSQDFSGMHPLRAGKIGDYNGVTFIPTNEIVSESLITGTGTGFYMFFYAFDAMVFTMDGQVEVHFDIIPDKRHALQVAHYATFSATRMHEEKIVRAETETVAV